MSSDPLILVLNAGSSSLKLATYAGGRFELRAKVERTNQIAHGRQQQFRIEDNDGREILCDTPLNVDRSSLLQVVLATLAKRLPGERIAAVGHRVVHGGDRFTTPVRVTPDILSALESLVPLAPLHQPHNLAEIRAVASLLPGVHRLPASIPRSTPQCQNTNACLVCRARTSTKECYVTDFMVFHTSPLRVGCRRSILAPQQGELPYATLGAGPVCVPCWLEKVLRRP